MPILYPALYDAVYARMRDLVSQVQTRRVNGTARVFRIVDAVHSGRTGADMFRKPYQSSANDNNRWTGPRPKAAPGGKPAASGVYTALGFNDALLGEFAYYAFHTTLDDDVRRQLDGMPTQLTSATFPMQLATKRVFVYEFPAGTRIADLSLTGQGGQALLRALGATPAVRDALQAATYASARDAYVADGDHSLPRAMAQLVCDVLPGYRVLWVSSARAEAAVSMADSQGDNLIFLGPDGVEIPLLKPVQEIWFRKASNGTYVHEVQAL
jgi:hypothetical protein